MSGTKVPRDPNMSSEVRRFLDDISRITDQLNASGFATIASPTFTGDPKAPTPTPGDNDTSIATTAFVDAAITVAVAALPDPLTRHAVEAVGAGTTYQRALPVGAKLIQIHLLRMSHNGGAAQNLQIELSDDNASTWSTAVVVTSATFAAASSIYGMIHLGHDGGFSYWVTTGFVGGVGGLSSMTAEITHYRLSWSGGANFDLGNVITWVM